MPHEDEKLILETIGDYAVNKKALDLSGQGTVYAKKLLESKASEVTLNNDGSEIISDEKIKVMDSSLEDFLDLCDETNETFDFIVLHSDRFLGLNYSLQDEHKELIRRLQNRQLNDAGILIFIVRDNGFVLDTYLKPGADKLTKKLNIDPENKTFQCWAFYN